MKSFLTYLEENKFAKAALVGTLGGIGLGLLAKPSQNTEPPAPQPVVFTQQTQNTQPTIAPQIQTPATPQQTQEKFQFSHPIIGEILGAISRAEHRAVGEFDHTVHNPKVAIRTKAGGGSSSAFGPYQLTRNTVVDHFKRRPELFSGNEEYVKQFIQQGNKFLKAQTNHPTYGLGGSGDLSGPEHHESHMRMADSVLQSMMADAKINYKDNLTTDELNRTIKRWRGVPEQTDPVYYRTVRTNFVN